MAAIQLLPGGGNTYTSEVFTGTGVGADEIDCSKCQALEIQQIVAGAPGGSFQIQERFNSSAPWGNMGTTITVYDPAPAKFSVTAGPFARIRINPASVSGLSTTVTLQIVIRGFSAAAPGF